MRLEGVATVADMEVEEFVFDSFGAAGTTPTSDMLLRSSEARFAFFALGGELGGGREIAPFDEERGKRPALSSETRL